MAKSIKQNKKLNRTIVQLKNLNITHRNLKEYITLSHRLRGLYNNLILDENHKSKNLKRTKEKINNLNEIKKYLKSELLVHALHYFNKERKENYGKDSENLSLSFYLQFIILTIRENLERHEKNGLLSKKICEQINEFLDSLDGITIALSASSQAYLKFLINKNDKNKKLNSLNKEALVLQTLLSSLSPETIVKLFKGLLNHLTLCLSKNECIPLDPKDLWDQEGNKIEINTILNKSSRKIRDTLISKDWLDERRTTLYNITTLFSDLCNYLVLANQNTRILIVPIIVSILFINRSIKIKETFTKNDIDRILGTVVARKKDPFNLNLISEFIPDLDRIIQDMINSVGKENFPSLAPEEFSVCSRLFVSGNAGPNGQSAILNLPFDCQALIDDEKLLDSIIDLGNEMGIKIKKEDIKLISTIDVPNISATALERESEPFRKLKMRATHSKVVIFMDSGGKERIVAEVDMVSQTVLNPIHDVLTMISDKLGDASGHFDQYSCFETSAYESILNGFIGTSDLKAATDLVYIEILATLVEVIFNKIYNKVGVGEKWSRVISLDREFTVSGFEDEYPEKISYGIGQPMGSKSSWVVLHLFLYIINQQAKINCGVYEDFKVTGQIGSFVSGDDNTTSLRKIYDQLMIISTGLELAINHTKSYCSHFERMDDTQEQKIFGEFLKKYVLDESIFQPIQPRKASKFFISPRTYIVDVIRMFSKINLIVDIESLLMYASLKEFDCETDGRNIPSGEEGSFEHKYNHLTEQIFFGLFGDNDIGGIEFPLHPYEDYISSGDNQYLTFLFINYDICNINYKTKSILIRNKISGQIASSKNRTDKAILTVFSQNSVSILKDVLFKPSLDTTSQNKEIQNFTISKNNDLIISGKVIEVKDDSTKAYFSSHPIYNQIIKILFSQKCDILRKAEDIRKEISPIELKANRGDITLKDLEILKNNLKKSKKQLNSLDFESLIGIAMDQDSDPTFRISGKMIKQFKSLTIIRVDVDLETYSIDMFNIKDNDYDF